jgi:hypothetical protein
MPSDDQLARLVIRVLAGVIALTLAGGVATAVGRLNEDSGPPPGLEAGGDPTPRPKGTLGPLASTVLAGYSDLRADALRGARGRRAAVVSFDSYLEPEKAREVLEDVDVVRLLVALPGGRPSDVAGFPGPDEGAKLVAQQRATAAEERKALLDIIKTVEDPDFRSTYQADIDALGALLAAPENKTDIVFGAVVVGDAGRLRDLASDPAVRLVDVGEDDSRPVPGSATGIRPEETTTAGEPPTRPV